MLPDTEPATPPQNDPLLAEVGTRLAARLLDLFVFWAPFALGVLALGLADKSSEGWGALQIVGICLMLLMPLSMPLQWFLVGTRGQSIGKLALGIRVVDSRGGVPSWITTLLAREGTRFILASIPFVGWLLGLADSLSIFRGSRQTLHDGATGTWVVLCAEPWVPAARSVRLSAVTKGKSSSVSPVWIGVAFGAGCLAIIPVIGVLAAIAIPNFITMQRKAKRSEVPVNVDAIKTAQLMYDAMYDGFLPVGHPPTPGELGKTPRPWTGGPDWAALPWSPDGLVRGAYWVEVSGDDFIVHGACDVDGDGEAAEYTATSSLNAARITPEDVY